MTGEIPREITDLVGKPNIWQYSNKSSSDIWPRVLEFVIQQLVGKIPIGTQLQNYDPSSFAGNPQLCGLPLERTCHTEGTCRPNVSSNQEDSDELITQDFYISLGLGLTIGFWGVSGSLIFKRSWRYAYYKFLKASNDWLYVKVALLRQKFKDVLNR
ncbi:hypothetical protein M0R45_034504 [Rubus argutus]|uniref:Uncharacterized protein n=1 Tax=Rubus argutus TaxID=59490 RepID=A0AAW1VR57_RUBAR